MEVTLRQVANLDGKDDNRFAAAACPDDDGSGHDLYPLGFTPPMGQFVRITFYASSPDQERFVVWAGDDSPTIPVGQVRAFQGTQTLEIGSWTGGQLWFTFQHCIRGRWEDYYLTGYDETGSTDVAYSGRLDCRDSNRPNAAISVARIAWGPAVRPVPTTANTPTYSVVFENIEILNTRSRDDDTNFASLGVTSPVGGKMGPVSRSLGDQDNGVHRVDLPISNVLVPKGGDKVNIAWSVVNSGHSNTDQVMNAIQTTIGQILDEVFGKGSIVSQIGSKIASLGLTFLFANCDGPVVGGNQTMTGDELYQATSGGDLVITLDHAGLNSPGGCGSNSRYKSTVRIKRTRN